MIQIFSAFAIVGLRNSIDILLATFTKGDIEYWLDELETRGTKEWVFIALKPLISCVYCMSSFWGTLFYFGLSLRLYGYVDLIMWIPSLLITAGIVKWIEK